jgi:hypothetical protein
MNKNDFDQFGPVWRAASEVYNVTPTDAALGLTFRVLEKYELYDIKVAIADYLATGQFPPKPADIIQRLTSRDGRPSADEAWAIAIRSFDEYQTVVMNDDISGALEQARDIYYDGDKVGARMAFKSAYDRNIGDSRREGVAVKWWPSIGFDIDGRRDALEQAVVQGLLPRAQVDKLLPAPLEINPGKLLTLAKKAETMTSEERASQLASACKGEL